MFSAEALSFRQQSRLAISLSWVGGFTNVFAFLTFKTFASHMTGASTLLGMNTANGTGRGVILYGVLVLAFILARCRRHFCWRRHGGAGCELSMRCR